VGAWPRAKAGTHDWTVRTRCGTPITRSWSISDGLVERANVVGSAIGLATTALLDADMQLAESVVSADENGPALRIHGCWECPAYPTPSTHRGDLEELVLGRQHSHARTDYKLVQLPVTGYRLVIATRLKAFINVDSQATAET
jgi:hypothetical protein